MANWFVAFPVKPPVNFDALFLNAPDVIRPFIPADLHITLAFMGSVGQERARTGWSYVEALAFEKSAISFAPLQGFGNSRHPSAFAFPVDIGKETVSGWIRSYRAEILTRVGARQDDRPPRPHMTIARLKKRSNAQQRLQAKTWAQNVTPPSGLFELDKICLYTWAEDRTRSQFQVVAEKVF